eukprot:390461-Prymnesium_polylepis.1
MGVEGLLIYKYLLKGDGHRACDYGAGKRSFLHAPLPLPPLGASAGGAAPLMRRLLPKVLLVGCGYALAVCVQLARRRFGAAR